MTCAGPASTSQIVVQERDWLGLSAAFLSGIALLRCWDWCRVAYARRQSSRAESEPQAPAPARAPLAPASAAVAKAILEPVPTNTLVATPSSLRA